MKIGLIWHPLLWPDRVREDLSRPLVRDLIGHRVHLALALYWCLCLPGPVSITEWAGIPLTLFSAIRVVNIWRVWRSALVQPLVMGALAWTAWQGATLLWSPDAGHGLREWSSCRWFLALWGLWPVMAHRRALIAALAAGFVLANLAQVWQAVAGPMGWPTWARGIARYSGWWPPAMAGSMLCAALGLHLPAAVMGRGRTRVVGVLGAAASAGGLVATGTRGAWLAGAALLVIALGFGVWRWMSAARGEGEGRTGRGLVLGAALVVVAGAGWFFLMRDSVAHRVGPTRDEIASALGHDYKSATGARVLMARMAIEEWRAHPIGGVGAGGYQVRAQEMLRARGEADNAPLIQAHAHNAALHIGATTGAVGLALWAFIVLVALRGGAEGSGNAGPEGEVEGRSLRTSGAGWGTYDAAPLFGLLGLLLVSAFDVVQLNSQTMALLGALLAMCMVSRPPAWTLPYRRGWHANG